MFGRPLISGALPSATPGPYKDIGYAYIRSSPLAPYTKPTPKNALTGQPALNVEEVGYSVFYPCAPVNAKGWVTWFPEPVDEMVDGYKRFLGKGGLTWIFKALKLIVGRLAFPAHSYASLLSSETKHPLVIFSHGLAGTRHTYTQYCSALASKGYVVLAVEHRDGSAPAVTLPSTTDMDGKQLQRVLGYIKKDEIVWDDGEHGTLEKFRTSQLEMRVREVYEAFYAFRRIVGNDVGGSRFEGLADDKKDEWLGSIKEKVDFSKVDLTGHSFGAGTILHLLHTSVPDKAYEKLPVQRAIALDPWLEPIPTPTASSPPSNAPETIPPVLIINSPGFTIWDTHFKRLKSMTEKINGSLVSIIGINHQSFSDFPLLSPSSPSLAITDLSTIHDLSNCFLEGRLSESEFLQEAKADHGDFERKPDGKMEGKKGSVVLHLLGKQV